MMNAEEISADKIKSGLGGYKKKATREYLDSLRAEYDSLYKENIELKDKLSVLSEGVQYYKNMEKSLQKALVLAERTTSETVHAAEVKAQAMEKEAQAKAEMLTKEARHKAEECEKDAARKAELLIRDAKQQADTAIAQGNEELRKVHSQIMTLIQQYEQYKSQYKQLALAQMNVLESEAYTLEAPILKNIQRAMEEKSDPHSMDTRPEQTEDQVVHPIPPVQKPVSDEMNRESQENDEKKVYVDGRGQVVEVHEFREVSAPGVQRDIFDDDFERNSTKDFSEGFSGSFSDYGEEESFSSEKMQEERNPDDFFKLYDSSSKANEQSQKEEEFYGQTRKEDNDFPSYVTSFEEPAKDRLQEEFPKGSLYEEPIKDNLQEEFPKESFYEEPIKNNLYEEPVKDDLYEDPIKNNLYDESVKEDVQGQDTSSDFGMDEQMRRIEQLQHERLRQEEARQEELAKASMGGFDEYSSMERQMDQGVSFEQNKMQTEDIGRMDSDFEESESYLSLSDIKRMDEEKNSSVPLPKASEKQEEYFGQLSSNSYSALHDTGKGDDFNTLSYELDHSRDVAGGYKEKDGFKSFRDFESEL